MIKITISVSNCRYKADDPKYAYFHNMSPQDTSELLNNGAHPLRLSLVDCRIFGSHFACEDVFEVVPTDAGKLEKRSGLVDLQQVIMNNPFYTSYNRLIDLVYCTSWCIEHLTNIIVAVVSINKGRQILNKAVNWV